MATADTIIVLEHITNVSNLDNLWSLRNVPSTFLALNNSNIRTFGWNINLANLSGLTLNDSFVNLVDGNFARVVPIPMPGYTPQSTSSLVFDDLPPTSSLVSTPSSTTIPTTLPSTSSVVRNAEVWHTFGIAVAVGAGTVFTALSFICWFYNRKFRLLGAAPNMGLADLRQSTSIGPKLDVSNYPYFGAGSPSTDASWSLKESRTYQPSNLSPLCAIAKSDDIFPEDSASHVGSQLQAPDMKRDDLRQDNSTASLKF
ncbi:uncharacterized protein PV09_01787 [Verruconis gallopava]|uniref:Uncharacterized protein n=1 Tax=Verruconis gallopava TaxID=253628 RepID=A0A0D2AM90_9PEZI|nr:uncharacterized protein PV09_01787 [Verruconis gallopava]KIW07873.1 hypothetical protein PV09_01787 [Verruconis gallopava]